MPWHVYLLRLDRGRIYVGCTNDLPRRLAEHRGGNGCRTTALSATIQLLHQETLPGQTAALARERQLKGWSRAKKVALAEGRLNDLKRLATSRQPAAM